MAAQQSFINNFENVINRGVDIQEDIKRYQDSLNYASSRVDYSVGQNIFMLPSDMNLNIGNVRGYNNEILVAGDGFVLGTNSRVNHHRVVSANQVGKKVGDLSVVGRVMEKGDNVDVGGNDTDKNNNVGVVAGQITLEEEKIALVVGISVLFSFLFWFL